MRSQACWCRLLVHKPGVITCPAFCQESQYQIAGHKHSSRMQLEKRPRRWMSSPIGIVLLVVYSTSTETFTDSSPRVIPQICDTSSRADLTSSSVEVRNDGEGLDRVPVRCACLRGDFGMTATSVHGLYFVWSFLQLVHLAAVGHQHGIWEHDFSVATRKTEVVKARCSFCRSEALGSPPAGVVPSPKGEIALSSEA